MRKNSGKQGGILTGVVVCLGSAMIVGAALIWERSATNQPVVGGSAASTGSDASRPIATGPLTKAELTAGLLMADLSPEYLAVAGVQAAQLAPVIQNAHEYLQANVQQFRSLQRSVREKGAEEDRLTKLVRGGLGTPQDAQSLAAVMIAAKTDREALRAMLDTVHTASCASLTQLQRNTLQAMRASTNRHLPLEYRALSLSPEQATQLTAELAASRETPGVESPSVSFESPAVSIMRANKAAIPTVSATWKQLVRDGN